MIVIIRTNHVIIKTTLGGQLKTAASSMAKTRSTQSQTYVSHSEHLVENKGHKQYFLTSVCAE